MMQTTQSAVRAIGLVTVFVLTGSAAAAQTAGQPERAPIQLGPFGLFPTLVVRGIGDPNVFNEAEGAKKDFTAVAVPAVEVVVQPPRLRLSYAITADLVYFHQQKSERSASFSSTARVDANLTYFNPFLIVSGAKGRSRPSSEIDLRARSTGRSYTAGARANLGPAAAVVLSVRRTTTVFDENQEFRGIDLSTELSGASTGIDATFRLALTPITTVGLLVAKEGERFDHSPLRDSNSLRAAATIAFQPFGLFNGSAIVGWRRFDALDPALEDHSGLSANGTIGLTLMERFHIETRFGRDVRSSYDFRTPTYVWTNAAATLRTDLFNRIDVRVTGGREVMAYKPLAGIPTAPRDVVVMYGGGLGYNLTSKIRIGVDAEHIQRKAEEKSRGYTSDRLLATVVWGVK
jgi:hypothetical protein